jgi:predicted RNA-binding Zn ribbon-like protein
MNEFLCLEFANTIVIQHHKLADLIKTSEELKQWLLEKNLLSAADIPELNHKWSNSEQNRLAQLAQNFRDELRRMAEKVVAKREIPESARESINDLLAQKSEYSSIEKTRSGFEIRKHRELDRPEQLLVPIAESATALLCNANLALVKKCTNPECTLFFFDSTKNHRRRWCSMQTCGNRMKVDAYWKRKHQSAH